MTTRKVTARKAAGNKGKKREHQVTKKPAAKAGVKVADHNWGAIFTGTRAQLVSAGLVPPKMRMPGEGKSSATYWLPLRWKEGWSDKCSGNLREMPPRWDATVQKDNGVYEVFVEFNKDKDSDVRERMGHALEAYERALIAVGALSGAIERIPPEPLSTQIPRWHEESKKWGQQPAKEAA